MNPHINIAPALSSDLGEIMDIENACFGADSFSRRQMAYLINRAKGIFLIVKFDKKMVGYLSFITSKLHHTGRIYSIAVTAEYRNFGIGGMLLSHVIEYAQKQDLKAIFLEVRIDNQKAISIYETNGFSKRFVKEAYYPDGGAAYSMVLNL